jgi:hypothetical protein
MLAAASVVAPAGAIVVAAEAAAAAVVAGDADAGSRGPWLPPQAALRATTATATASGTVICRIGITP